MGLIVLGGCQEGQRLTCSDRPKGCVRVLEQAHLPASDGEEARLAIRVANECSQPVDFKLCFEDTRGGADCREHTAVPRDKITTEMKEERFAGQGIKLFARFSDEAKYCTFPLTDRVTF